jgi:hypothetical protein
MRLGEEIQEMPWSCGVIHFPQADRRHFSVRENGTVSPASTSTVACWVAPLFDCEISVIVSRQFRVGSRFQRVGCVMTSRFIENCSRPACANAVPATLANEHLCLQHFLDEAFLRANQAVNRCRQGRAIDPKGVECLLADSLAVVNNLEETSGESNWSLRDRMLELLLILANLHEYVAHHSVRLERLA